MKVKIINPKNKPLPSKVAVRRKGEKIDIFTKPKRKRLA